MIRATFILAWFSIVTANAQEQVRLYYNTSWQLTIKDSAVYYRDAVLDKHGIFDGPLKDYTIGGTLVMTGNYAYTRRTGPFTFYDARGRRRMEGKYGNGFRVGRWVEYHPNGALKAEAFFEEAFQKEGKMKLVELRDSLGNRIVSKGTGIWVVDYEEPVSNIRMTIEGELRNSIPEGIWTWSLPDGTVWSSSTFNKGEFKSGFIVTEGERVELAESFGSLFPELYKFQITEGFGSVVPLAAYPFLRNVLLANESEVPGIYVQVPPAPIGGYEAFYKEISKFIEYPKEARRIGFQGRVVVIVSVDLNGEVTNVRVPFNRGHGLEEEAMRVVIASNKKVKWRPGISNRKKVKTTHWVPIDFRLN